MILKKLNILNVKELFLQDQLGLVDKLMKAALINFPYQNVSAFGAFLPRERPTPTPKDIVQAAWIGRGGICGHLNNWFKWQLESLGYKVDLIPGHFNRAQVPNTHFVIKLTIPGYALKDKEGPRNDEGGRTYIVDIGSGIPLHEPICIETLPYIGRAGGLDWRYEWGLEDNKVVRVHENGDAMMGKKPPEYVSPQDCVTDLQPLTFAEFMPNIRYVMSNPESNHLHTGFYCFRYLNFDQDNDDFKIVCIRGTELIFITKETRESHRFKSVEEVKPSLLKYFPMIPRREVELATKHFSMPFKEALKMSSRSG